MTERRAVLLVARRELRERLRGRPWQISTALTVLLVAIVGFLVGVLDRDETERFDVGAQGSDSMAIAEAARAAAPRLDARVTVHRFESAAAARSAVRNEDVDAAVAGGELLTAEDPPATLVAALQSGARNVRGVAILRAQGVPAEEAERALDPPPLQAREVGAADEEERPGVAFVAAFLLYTQLAFYGLAVASGVVEEKTSRVVEVLLSTISPRSLLAGKVVGIGLLGLLQLLLTAVVGVAVGSASGAIELDGLSLGTLAGVVVWFLCGYALYACLYAVAGVVVSRQEDLQGSSTALTLVLVVAYVLVFPVVEDPSSTLAMVASIVPLSSPMIMPARIAMGEVPAAEMAASLALLLATVALLLPIGARIYEGAILRMGKPVKLVETWRTARA